MLCPTQVAFKCGGFEQTNHAVVGGQHHVPLWNFACPAPLVQIWWTLADPASVDTMCTAQKHLRIHARGMPGGWRCAKTKSFTGRMCRPVWLLVTFGWCSSKCLSNLKDIKRCQKEKHTGHFGLLLFEESIHVGQTPTVGWESSDPNDQRGRWSQSGLHYKHMKTLDHMNFIYIYIFPLPALALAARTSAVKWHAWRLEPQRGTPSLCGFQAHGFWPELT